MAVFEVSGQIIILAAILAAINLAFYYFVINSEFTAIGFVLAAKGIISIRDPNERPSLPNTS